MDAGLVLSWNQYEIACDVDMLVTRNGTTTAIVGIASGGTRCKYSTSNALDTIFAEVACSIVEDTGVYTRTWTVYLDGVTTTVNSAGNANMTAALVFDDLKVYIKPDQVSGYPMFWISWSAAKWYRDGVLDQDLGAGSKWGTHFAPSGCPLLGIPAETTGTAGATPTVTAPLGGETGSGSVSAAQPQVPAYGNATNVIRDATHVLEAPLSDAITCPYSLTAFKFSADATNPATGDITVTATVTGGWRFKPDSGGSWITPAITLQAVTTPLPTPGNCSCDPGMPSVSGSNTYAMSANSYYFNDIQLSANVVEFRQGSINGFPAWAKELNRMNSDYRALISRWKMLGAQHRQTTTCDKSPEDECHVNIDNMFPADVDISGTVLGDLRHSGSATCNLVNFNGAPLWSFDLEWPETGGAGSYQWQAGGADQDSDSYFLPIREQFIEHPGIPSGEQSLTRNSVISEPLQSGWFSQFFDVWTDRQTSWWGIGRFDKMAYTMPNTYAYTSAHSALYAPTNCTLVHGISSTTVTLDVGKTSCEVALVLHSLSVDPRMLPQIAWGFATEWADGTAAVVSVDVYMENPHGDRKLLTSVSSATAVRKPSDISTDTKYAGSHAQDMGAGAITDTGADTETEGESTTVMTDADRVNTYQLLAGFGADNLVFVIVVDTAGGTMTLTYPVLTTPEGAAESLTENFTPKTVAENSNWSSVVWSNLSHARFTQWNMHNGINLQAPPLVMAYGVHPNPNGGKKPSAVDAFGFKRLQLEGNNPSSANLLTDMATIYDSVEGTTLIDLNSQTVAFAIQDPTTNEKGGLYMIVNSWREVPPAISVPTPARDDDYDPDRTDWGLYSWSFIKSERDIVHRDGRTLQLRDPGNGTVWTTIVPIIAGWQSAQHDHAVDGTELDDHELLSSIVLATVSPWHGYSFLGSGPGFDLHPTNYEASPNYYHRATRPEGNIVHRSSDYGAPYKGFDRVTNVTATGFDAYPSITRDPLYGAIILVWERENPTNTFETFKVESDDEGLTWSSEVSLGAWRYPRVFANKTTILYMGFKYDSGSSGPGKIFVRIRHIGETVISAEVNILDTGAAAISFADELFDGTPALTPGAPWVLVAKLAGSSDVTEFHSHDEGLTWEAM